MADRSIVIRQAQGLLVGVILTVFAIEALADASTYHVHVSGLACPFCAYGLERSLGKIEGVETVAVSLKTGLIHVSVRDGRALDEAEVKEAVKDAGFTVESFGRAEPIAVKEDDNGA